MSDGSIRVMAFFSNTDLAMPFRPVPAVAAEDSHPNRWAIGVKSTSLWLTNHFAEANLNNEYRTRPRGDTFDPKPHAKEQSRRTHSAFESPPDDRAARLAGRVQNRHGSRQKPRFVLVQRG